MTVFVIVAQVLLTTGVIAGQFDQPYPSMDACRAAIPAAQAALEQMLEQQHGVKALKIDMDCVPAKAPGQDG